MVVFALREGVSDRLNWEIRPIETALSEISLPFSADEDKPAVEASTNHVNGDAESPKENASDVNEVRLCPDVGIFGYDFRCNF